MDGLIRVNLVNVITIGLVAIVAVAAANWLKKSTGIGQDNGMPMEEAA